MVVAVHLIGIALGVSSDTLKSIARNHFPQQYKFSRKKIGIGISYDGSKLFTVMPGACKVKLALPQLDKYEYLI